MVGQGNLLRSGRLVGHHVVVGRTLAVWCPDHHSPNQFLDGGARLARFRPSGVSSRPSDAVLRGTARA